MKKSVLIVVLSALTITNSFAGEMDVVKCTLKVSKAVKALASLEIGKNLSIAESIQEEGSTATNFTVTIINTKKPAQLVYIVKTIDILPNFRCVIDSINLK